MALIDTVIRRFGTVECLIDSLHTANYTVDDVAEVVYEFLKLRGSSIDEERHDLEYMAVPMSYYLELFKEACNYLASTKKRNYKYLNK